MTVFYQALKSGNLTKIQALQQAQMELINLSNQKRASIIATLQEGGVSEAVMAQLDHPYYGSSFILIGNG
jgi:CHAT domain-containing protein